MALTSEGHSLDEARVAAGRGRWAEAYDILRSADESALDPADLELLADCAWWRCRVDEEIAICQRAHAGFVALGQVRRAAYTAWMLSVRHGLRGERPAASGWLRRAQRLLAEEPECLEHGYVACSEAEEALGQGRTADAEALAQRAVRIGQRFDARGLVALGISWQGLALIAGHEVASGTALLDEAMCSVMAGELDSHFTGWVYCFAIGMCMGVVDLGRAVAWTDAARAWCESLPEPTPYHRLCRVRQVEVMSWRGELERAETEARRACEEMLAFEPHLAGEAFYVAGPRPCGRPARRRNHPGRRHGRGPSGP